MGIDVGGTKGGVNSEINVVPMVDIMLVLLVIFMLVAPMLQAGVNVKLPEASNTADKPETTGQTIVAITPNGLFHVNGIQVRETELAAAVEKALEESSDRVVLVKGDEDAPYSAIMAAMDQLREAQVENIGLITDQKRLPGEGGGN